MEVISEDLVNETWQETARFNPKEISKEMKKVGITQPELLAFMVEFTQDLDQGVKELAIYMFLNVYRMFQKCLQKRIRKVSSNELIDCYDHNEKFIDSLEGTHEKFYDRIARVQLSGQPYVMRYVLETFFEAPEEEDPVTLTEEDTGDLFLLFKTVIDVLNKTTDA
jgi:hypothetical protein